MNLDKPFYVKSLETDLATKRLVDGEKRDFQTIEEMVRPSDGSAPHISPNTVSFGQSDRLACTILNNDYRQTYRAQGIIFQTDAAPDYVAPFDLMVLANVEGEKIISDYYKIVANLKEHYGRSLIPGYQKFIFRSPDEMLAKIPNPEVAWKLVNEFRVEHGLTPVPEDQKRLVDYNEVIFHKAISIEPVAIYGSDNLIANFNERARRLGLPVYPSAGEFCLKVDEMKAEREAKGEFSGNRKR